MSDATLLVSNLPSNIKPLTEFPGYFISDTGVVYTSLKICSVGFRNGTFGVPSNKLRPMSPNLGTNGYHSVHFRKDKKSIRKMIHRLVLETFVGPCPPSMEACHEDGTKLNNRLDNLRWDTRKGNFYDKRKHGTHLIGERCNAVKLSTADVLEIRKLLSIKSNHEIGQMFGVSRHTIYAIRTGKTWGWLKAV